MIDSSASLFNPAYFLLFLLATWTGWFLYRRLAHAGRCPVCRRGKLREARASVLHDTRRTMPTSNVGGHLHSKM